MPNSRLASLCCASSVRWWPVSVETMKLVAALPALEEAKTAGGEKVAAGEDYPTQVDLDAAHVYVAEGNGAENPGEGESRGS